MVAATHQLSLPVFTQVSSGFGWEGSRIAPYRVGGDTAQSRSKAARMAAASSASCVGNR